MRSCMGHTGEHNEKNAHLLGLRGHVRHIWGLHLQSRLDYFQC